MSDAADALRKMSLDDLTDGARQQDGSQQAYMVELELRRRRELAQQVVDAKMVEAAQAQIDAVAASKDTAYWTKFSAIAVAISVAILAIATVIDAAKP